MTPQDTPFPNDPDRHALWEMLVPRDIAAFLAADWSMVDDDFAHDRFFGMHGHFRANPDSWRLAFPDVATYRDEWLRQARDTATERFAEDLGPAMFRATTLRDIDIAGDRAVLHKKFDGTVARADAPPVHLNWQTLYFCARIDGRWKITGFVGYIPHPLA